MTGSRPLLRLASLKLTLAGMVLLAALLGWSRVEDRMAGDEVVVPLALLFVNLTAAVLTNRAFRAQPGLLVFHVGLALLALTAGLGQLTGLVGRVAVTEGTRMDPRSVIAEAGPLHRWGLDQVDFVQGPIAIDFAAGMHRVNTRSEVRVGEGGGTRVIGDEAPLMLSGYRFGTTPNKGFAPVLAWTPAGGGTGLHAVHLPSYPINDTAQTTEWALPDGAGKVTLWLEFTPIFDETKPWRFRLPDDPRLVVLEGERREVLRPGEDMALAGGRLRFERVTTWMGYGIVSAPMVPWMIASVVVAALGLAWHVAGKLRALTDSPAWHEAAHG